MRLIDADALLETLCSVQITIGGRDVFPRDAKDTVLRIVDEQPTIDPYKHGEWIRYEDTHEHTIKYICPICYDYTAFRADPGEYTVRGNYIYCRKCGAKMGG